MADEMPDRRVDSDATVIRHSSPRASRSSSLSSHDEGSKTNRRDDDHEALIAAAARAVVESIERDDDHGSNYNHEDQEDDSFVTDDGTEDTGNNSYLGGTELTYTESEYSRDDTRCDANVDPPEPDHHSSSASAHEDDDVFSQASPRSSRHSGSPPLAKPDQDAFPDSYYQDDETDTSRRTSAISRIPSSYSSIAPAPQSLGMSPAPQTPSRVFSRPPFRTPSSVRAMQMRSPTPSLPTFMSPGLEQGSHKSSPRHSRSSRVGTPMSKTPKKKMGTPLKIKKEYPLVLLHVTVLPLQWPFSRAVMEQVLNRGMLEAIALLKEKVGKEVQDRGVLVAHPGAEYEMLEERLLEVLELPGRRRGRILGCGHYLGPDDEDAFSGTDTENEEGEGEVLRRCGVCRRNVRVEKSELFVGKDEKKFRIKVYASNGLMGAGAWAAAWREMERVDVEIEPWVGEGMRIEMERLMHEEESEALDPTIRLDDTMADDEDEQETPREPSTSKDVGLEAEAEREPEIEAENGAEHEAMAEPELETELAPETESQPEEVPQVDKTKEGPTFRSQSDKAAHVRDIHDGDYDDFHPQASAYSVSSPATDHEPKRTHHSPRHTADDSLGSLLLAAAKMALKDPKNVLIIALSALVILMGFREVRSVGDQSDAVSYLHEPFGIAEDFARYAGERPLVQGAKTVAVEIADEIVRDVKKVPEKVAQTAKVVPGRVAGKAKAAAVDAGRMGKSAGKAGVKKVQREVVEMVEAVTEKVKDTIAVDDDLAADGDASEEDLLQAVEAEQQVEEETANVKDLEEEEKEEEQEQEQQEEEEIMEVESETREAPLFTEQAIAA